MTLLDSIFLDVQSGAHLDSVPLLKMVTPIVDVTKEGSLVKRLDSGICTTVNEVVTALAVNSADKAARLIENIDVRHRMTLLDSISLTACLPTYVLLSYVY